MPYAEFQDFGDLVPDFLNEHLLPAGYEILEWLDDPLIFNVSPSDPFGPVLVASNVPAWTSPFYLRGCGNVYEVADPLETGAPAVGVPNSEHLDLFADAVFQAWFARRSPSTSIGGRYDAGGVFSMLLRPCL